MQPMTLLAVFVMVVAVQALVWAPFISGDSEIAFPEFSFEKTFQFFYNLGTPVVAEPETSLSDEPIIEEITKNASNPANEMSLITSRPTYLMGETIRISGTVENQFSDSTLTLQILDTEKNKIASKSLIVSPANEFSAEFSPEGALWEQTGIYTIQLADDSGQSLIETLFVFDSTGKNTVFS